MRAPRGLTGRGPAARAVLRPATARRPGPHQGRAAGHGWTCSRPRSCRSRGRSGGGRTTQVTGIFEYIRKAGLVDAVKKNDYLTVAKVYNGKGQAATYAALIKNAADAYKRVTAGKKHVIP